METYKQKEKKSCGPDAVSWAYSRLAGLPYSEAQDKVYRAWGWLSAGDIRDNLMDSPGQHERVAKRLGLSFGLATLGELERGQLPSQTTVMLVHLSASDPSVQHWAVLAAYTSDGRTRWHWGDGTIKELSRETVREYYSRWAPACIYTLSESASEPLPWYARAWAGMMEKLFGSR